MPLFPSGRTSTEELNEVRKAVRPGDPARSPLLQKALGNHHLGGRNLDEDTCETRLLSDWIRGRRGLSPCPDPPPSQRAPELPRALLDRLASCASAACHGGAVSPRLFDPTLPTGAGLDARSLERVVDRVRPTHSVLLHRMLGEGGHAASLRSDHDRDYLDIAAWIGGASLPEGRSLPSLDGYAREVHPILVRRGCTNGACHGSGGVTLTLFPDTAAIVDNWVRLAPRAASGLLLHKARNLVAHGGGSRLGGPDDCSTRVVEEWVAGRPSPSCRPSAPPDFNRFAQVVQPSLETLTCPRCHGDGGLTFHFEAKPDRATLERNYREVLAHVDTEYPPASSVLLRVSEDCMQARILAWVGREPDPGCTVDLKNFRGRFPER